MPRRLRTGIARRRFQIGTSRRFDRPRPAPEVARGSVRHGRGSTLGAGPPIPVPIPRNDLRLELDRHRVLVTGGTRGIGLELDQTEILVGKAGLVTRLHRWLPGLGARMLKDG